VLLIDADQSMLEVYEEVGSQRLAHGCAWHWLTSASSQDEDEEKRPYLQCIFALINQLLRDKVVSNSRDELAIVLYNTVRLSDCACASIPVVDALSTH
jgi:hypothetical protein